MLQMSKTLFHCKEMKPTPRQRRVFARPAVAAKKNATPDGSGT